MPEIEATSQNEVQSFLDSNGGIAVVDCYATYLSNNISDGVDLAKQLLHMSMKNQVKLESHSSKLMSIKVPNSPRLIKFKLCQPS